MIPDEDQRALQDTARRFARERLLPHYIEREEIGVLDRGLVREMGRLGLLGVDLPQEHGGLGTSSVTAGIIAEELAYGDFNVSAVRSAPRCSAPSCSRARRPRSRANGCRAWWRERPSWRSASPSPAADRTPPISG